MAGLPVTNFVSDASSSLLALKSPTLTQSINCARYSEDLTWAYYTVANTATKTGTVKTAAIDGKIITLSEITSSNIYAISSMNFSAAGYTPFVAGKKYLYSFYLYSAKDFWWNPRSCTGGVYGQGTIWCRGGYVTRISCAFTATSTSNGDFGDNPLVAPGSGTSVGLPIFNQNNNGNSDVYVGGFMIEPLPSSYLDGIAMIGDSTMQGSAGTKDLNYDFNVPSNREWSTILGSELQIPVFNRGISGNKLSDMAARWTTDVSVLKPRCNAVIIQGGINDISTGATLAQMQTSVQSMTSKAVSDGFQKIYYVNITPFASATSDPTKETLRQQYNAWLTSTYGNKVCDIASAVADSVYTNTLASACYGDGTHFTFAGKLAIAVKIINSLDFSWIIKPSAYVKVQA